MCFRRFWNAELSLGVVGMPALASSTRQMLGSGWKAKWDVAKPRRIVCEWSGGLGEAGSGSGSSVCD